MDGKKNKIELQWDLKIVENLATGIDRLQRLQDFQNQYKTHLPWPNYRLFKTDVALAVACSQRYAECNIFDIWFHLDKSKAFSLSGESNAKHQCNFHTGRVFLSEENQFNFECLTFYGTYHFPVFVIRALIGKSAYCTFTQNPCHAKKAYFKKNFHKTTTPLFTQISHWFGVFDFFWIREEMGLVNQVSNENFQEQPYEEKLKMETFSLDLGNEVKHCFDWKIFSLIMKEKIMMA